ncbi:hypothetical protein ACFT30_10465 [Microbacterium ureisolvens]|uniref:hypothetical protein n=1 Tax=Microbacterium ureisolvens TaxID=2781186 RepID=UPI003628F57A
MSDGNRYRYVGTYDGVEISLSVNVLGRVLVGTMNPQVAHQLDLPRVDKYWWEREVPPDDPRLVIQEIREPSADDTYGSDGLDPGDRYFARLDGDRVPMALMRRHFTDTGYEDQILRDVDDWKPDARGSVSRAILYALESDLEEVTVEQAGHILHMAAQRSFQPLPSSTVTRWESQGCPVCRRQWETSERPRFVAENTADHSELFRCDTCHTWWLMTERYAAAVRPDDIRNTYAEFLHD